MNHDQLESSWKSLKGDIRSAWGKVTDDELERVKGNMTSIAGIIQGKYGDKKEEIKLKLDSIMKKFADKTEATKNKLDKK